MDDDALTARLARDLDGSFEALVLAHQDRLYTIALRLLGDPRDAEEAAQDAFVRAYRALAVYDEARIRALALRAWLATIVVHLARNRRRNAADRRPAARLELLLDAGHQPVAPIAATPQEAALRRDAARTWATRLARCPATSREALVLRHVDGLTYEEIAEALGRPTGTVKAQVHRGIACLRDQLAAEAAGGAEPGAEGLPAEPDAGRAEARAPASAAPGSTPNSPTPTHPRARTELPA